ncbi:MAG: hypothetical protein PHW76_04240 [Alphaproteobacteria bacterium]|nr:hypothetical protein [Alphaproteobacteria bacterium]
MSIHDMKISKFSFVAIIAALAFALAANPASAKAPKRSSSNNLTQVVSEAPPPSAPTQLDPSLSMASSSAGADGLVNFGPSSGTVVGNRAQGLKDEVVRLRQSVNLNSNEFSILRTSGAAGAVQYHSTVAAITARLQNGTTKGNPILLRQWEEADASLNEVGSSLDKLNSLLVSVDADASVASYLMDSIQAAFDLSGAIDEDHDQLKMLKDETSRMVTQLDYLRNQTTADIQRQQSYLSTERSNLQALAYAISRGEMLGNSLANRAIIVNRPTLMQASSAPVSSAPYTAPQAAPASPVTSGPLSDAPVSSSSQMSETSTGHLLVLVRFNQPNVEYEQQLAQAVGQAIERHPNAEFSVVAVAPSAGDPAETAEQQRTAKRNADEIKRSLIALGLSPSRINVASTLAQTAQSPEVHIYIR